MPNETGRIKLPKGKTANDRAKENVNFPTVTNETKHTPGPWTISKFGQSISIDAAPIYTSAGLAFLNPLGARTQEEPDPVDMANARLISAAPELLDALKDAFSDLNLYWRDDWENRALAIKIRAAIAKAEGR